MNYVPATDLEVHFSVLKKGVPILLTIQCMYKSFCTQGSSSSENAKCTFIIYYYICFPLCAHILYFDEAKFSIKLFSLVYFTVSVVRQRNEYEIETETRPIKTT